MNTQPTQSSHASSFRQLPVNDSAAESPADGVSSCCSLAGLTSRLGSRGVAMPAMLAVTLFALAAAGYFAGVASGLKNNSQHASASDSLVFPATIDATGAVASENYSIATGLVSEEAEGFFVLDHNSGLLQCSVFYPRVGKFLGNFTGNAGELVGAGGKGGSYMMVTGQADMTRGGRGGQIAPTLVYVLNTANGNFAAFAIPFDRQASVTGRPQQAGLIPMGTGTASTVPTR